MRSLLLCTALVALLARVIDGMVEPLQTMPDELMRTFEMHRKIGDLTKQPGQIIFWHSLEKYMCKFAKSRPSMTETQTTYLRDTVRGFMQPVYDVAPGRRKKRQAILATPRIRRDLYSMSQDERRRFFEAVIALKRDRRLFPSVYDCLCDFHLGQNIARAHFGPGFPGWHRIYLWLFESFLRLHDPTVTLPFWNSAADNEMDDSRLSPIWRNAFYGSGTGEPQGGPFQYWRQYNTERAFTRNIGSGSLYQYATINRIINSTRNREILLPSPRTDRHFEFAHAATHVYCGGSMNNLNEAVRDPIFYAHHCFVDFIWERFRFNQYYNGINPGTDYPYTEGGDFTPEHRPTAMMGFFPGGQLNWDWPHRTGYTNNFFRLVQYEQAPECNTSRSNNNNCNNSPFYQCRRQLCVTRPWYEIPNRFRRPFVDNCRGRHVRRNGRVRLGCRRGRRVKRQVVHEIQTCPKRNLINDVDYRWMESEQQSHAPSIGTQGPIQNNDWVYILAKFVVKRNDRYKPFQTYSFGNINGQFGLKNTFLRPDTQYAYPNCEKYQDAVNKIKIVSYGLNYPGYAEEYALADNRLAVAVSYGFVPVKRPRNGAPSEAIIAAFDSCGRVCRPYCKSGSSTNMHMLGGIRVTNTQPLHYGNSYAESTLSAWQISSPASCPTLDYNNIPLSFFCEYTDNWLWSPTSPGQGMTSPNRGMHGPDPRLNPDLMVEPRRPGLRPRRPSRRQRMGRRRGDRRGMGGRGRRVGVPFRGNPDLHSFVTDALGRYSPGQVIHNGPFLHKNGPFLHQHGPFLHKHVPFLHTPFMFNPLPHQYPFLPF